MIHSQFELSLYERLACLSICVCLLNTYCLPKYFQVGRQCHAHTLHYSSDVRQVIDPQSFPEHVSIIARQVMKERISPLADML